MPHLDGESLSQWNEEEIQQLVLGAQRRDPEALDTYSHVVSQLADQYIRREVSARLLLETTVEDLVQEALRRSIAGLPRFRYRSGAEFHSWLNTGFGNVIRREAERQNAQLRDARRKVSLEEVGGDVRANQSSPLTRAQQSELKARVQAAVAALPHPERELVAAVWLRGQTLTSVAKRLGLNPKTAAKRMYKAVARLKFVLGSEAS